MKPRRALILVIGLSSAISAVLLAWGGVRAAQQDQKKYSQTPTIEEYQPRSTLVTKEHKIERAKFPFIDIHSHHWNPTPEQADQLAKEMDS
ncbi:MAG: hypothetical protein DMG38_25900, partial [Acidobacteria bacterium]